MPALPDQMEERARLSNMAEKTERTVRFRHVLAEMKPTRQTMEMEMPSMKVCSQIVVPPAPKTQVNAVNRVILEEGRAFDIDRQVKRTLLPAPAARRSKAPEA